MKNIRDELNNSRNEVTNLTIDNPFINYNQENNTGLLICDMNPIQIYNDLVNDSKSLSFASLNQTKTNGYLKTTFDESTLQDRLGKIYRHQKRYIEENGTNTLFLCIGFLKWKDRENNNLNSPLILIPVDISRVENSQSYFISYSGERIRFNMCLRKKIENDYSLDLDFKSDEDLQNLDDQLIFTESQFKNKYKEWKIDRTRGMLIHFDYGQYVIADDLDLSFWKDKMPFPNKISNDLFNDNVVSEENFAKDHVDPNNLIYNANKYQRKVIEAICDREDYVVEGATGTGKAQTIANIMATFAAKGKSILFITKKKAALYKINRLLENMGLSDLVLELHTHKTNKKDVLKRIEKTLTLGSLKNGVDPTIDVQYKEIVAKLDDVFNTINEPISNSKMNLSEILGQYLKIKELLESENMRIPKIDIFRLEKMDKEYYEKCLNTIQKYSEVSSALGVIEKHPFQYMKARKTDEKTLNSLLDALDNIDMALNQMMECASILEKMWNRPFNNILDGYRFIFSVGAIKQYGSLKNINVNDYRITYNHQEILDAISSIKKTQKFLKKNIVKKELFLNRDVFSSLYNRYINEEIKEKKEYYLKKLKAYFNSTDNIDKSLKNVNAFINKSAPTFAQLDLIYHLFKEINSSNVFNYDYSKVKDLLKDALSLQDLITKGYILYQTKAILDDEEKIKTILDNSSFYVKAKNSFEKNLSLFFSLSSYDVLKRFNTTTFYEDMSFNDLRKLVNEWLNKKDDIINILNYNALIYRIKELEIDPILDIKLSPKKMKHLTNFFTFAYLEELINYSFSQYPLMNDIKKAKMEKLWDTLQDLDQKRMIENAKKIVSKHYDNMQEVKKNSKEMNILRREKLKKRNQMPVKKLLLRLHESVQAIKPIFIATPTSISSFLMGSDMVFDLVIFNESSRISAFEGLGSILRARQVVAFGDSMQFNPSSSLNNKTTFLSLNVMDFLRKHGVKEMRLKYQYRSLYSSLLNFINENYYRKQLLYFPSAYEYQTKEGIILEHINNGIYDKKASTNIVEVRKIAKACIEHAKNNPSLSLGVISLTLSQQVQFTLEIEKLLVKEEDPKVKDFFSIHKNEPFFAKDVFAAQGDDRDVIFVSLVYGQEKSGEFPIEFNPLSTEFGSNALNVAISCARRKCVIYSSINSYDIDTTNKNKGMTRLYTFLKYLEDKQRVAPKNNITNPMQQYLSKKIEERGFYVDNEIGANHGIDIAIAQNENSPFILGIELDNGEYGKMDDLIDREKIRRQLLKNRGWRIYHIWSTEFCKNPKSELEKIFDVLKTPVKLIPASKEQTQFKVVRKNSEASDEKINLDATDYKQYVSPFKRNPKDLYDEEKLRIDIEGIIIQESPIPLALLKKRIGEIYNVTEFDDEESANITSIAQKDERFELKNGFMYEKKQQITKVRNRSKLDASSRKVDYIPDEELEIAITYVLNAGLVATEEELYKEIGTIFGFKNNSRLTERLQYLVALLLDRGKLYLDKGLLYLND